MRLCEVINALFQQKLMIAESLTLLRFERMVIRSKQQERLRGLHLGSAEKRALSDLLGSDTC